MLNYINEDLMTKTEMGKNSSGGTELLKYHLFGKLPRDLLQEYQIFFSRVEEKLDESKIRIYYAHDIAGDPASDHALKEIGWEKFHKLVFVSNWQMQNYIKHYDLPWSKCIVLQNAITPIEQHEKSNDKIRMIYFSTPHRGLEILVPVFEKLAEEYKNIELDVFSSFKLYGWDDRDKLYQKVFDRCIEHPQINYHGSVTNEEIREHLKKSHILSYPCIWQETSCLTLLESMSAGLHCVHPNYGALPETASNWTLMYQWHEKYQEHAGLFYTMLKQTIDNVDNPFLQDKLKSQKSYIDIFYSWDRRIEEWKAFLNSLLTVDRKIMDTKKIFTYNTMK